MMAYNLPAIIHRLDSTLIAVEMCKRLDLGIRPELALEAMTKDSDNSDDHAADKIDFQSGMGNNYERLEFLGDSFLKMSTTIALFCREHENNECYLHVDRMVMITNGNLFKTALDLRIEESIRSKSFNRRLWYPETLNLLKGKRSEHRDTHDLSKKSIADVCEALIGAAYLTGCDDSNNVFDMFDMAVKAVTRVVNNDAHAMEKFTDLFAAYETPEWQMAGATAAQKDMADKIEAKLGYHFKYPLLLRSAFLHASYGFQMERIPSYERLEFLGDALLDMLCVDHLFRKFPSKDPQWMTEHKGALVSNQFLGCLCVSLGFHRYMGYMSTAMPKEIAKYTEALHRAREAAIEAASSDRDRESSSTTPECAPNFWMDAPDPPKALPDIVEAYMGAIFVDSGFDFTVVRDFFNKQIVGPWFADMSLYDTYASNHPVTLLASHLQIELGCRHWRLLIDEVDQPEGTQATKMNYLCALLIHGRVQAHASAQRNGRHAKTACAQKALGILQGISLDQFRDQFGCDCHGDKAK